MVANGHKLTEGQPFDAKSMNRPIFQFLKSDIINILTIGYKEDSILCSILKILKWKFDLYAVNGEIRILMTKAMI